MKSVWLLLLIFPGLTSLCGEISRPTWLWSTSDKETTTAAISHRFDLSSTPESAALTITSDFAAVDVFVNEVLVGELEDFDPVSTFSIEAFLRDGTNRITLRAPGSAGPSAIAAEIRIVDSEGELTIIPTNAKDWEGNNIIAKGLIRPERWAPNFLPEISPSSEYNQWKEALADGSAKSLSPLPPGFSLSLIRSAEESEDSWVSMTIDTEGRFIVAKERRGLLRITLDGERKKVLQVESINEELEECRGLTFRSNSLYANANNSKAIFRLRDTNGDDHFDEVVKIQTTEGSVGHGRNDLAVGPKDAIHAIHGDSVTTPDRTVFRTPEEDARSKPLGHWLTLGNQDEDWVVLARGLRNPYGIDFNSHGEAFTYDADNEGDVGLPFYRPSRINHLVEGANYGWHQRPGSTRSIPVYAPDSLPTTFDVGRGSPTGVKFVPDHHWGPHWKDTLLALDWAYGRIVAVVPTPRGAGYYASGSVFLEGRPLNVTDLEFDDEGNLWFITGGRKTKSALFCIRYDQSEAKQSGDPLPKQAALREVFSSNMREVRKRISRRETPITGDSECWKHLGNPDPWLRHAARTRLERRPPSEWTSHLADLDQSLAKLTGALALVRQGTKPEQKTALAISRNLSKDNWKRTEKLTFLRIAELAVSAGIADLKSDDEFTKQALAWVSGPDDPVTRECIRLLSLLDRPEAIAIAQDLFARAKTQPDQLFFLEKLSRITRGWTSETRTRLFKALATTKATASGDRFLPPFLNAIESDSLSSIPEDERPFWKNLLQPESPAEELITTPGTFVQNWTLADFQESDFSGESKISTEDGLSLFRAALCHRCHLFGKEGIAVGPDLSQAGSRYTSMDLLESILQPSSVVAEVYRNISVEKKSGEVITGRLVKDDFRKSLLYLSTNPFAPRDLTKIPKENIRSLTESRISPMPPALLSSMKKEEVILLIRWLRKPPTDG